MRNEKKKKLLFPLLLLLLKRLRRREPQPLLLVRQRVVPLDGILVAPHFPHRFAWVALDGDGERPGHRVVAQSVELVLGGRAVRRDLAARVEARAGAARVFGRGRVALLRGSLFFFFFERKKERERERERGNAQGEGEREEVGKIL